jgi:hypothetical protein
MKRQQTRLELERLEDRLVPSAYYWRGGGQEGTDAVNFCNVANWQVMQGGQLVAAEQLPCSADDLNYDAASGRCELLFGGTASVRSLQSTNFNNLLYIRGTTLAVGGENVNSYWRSGDLQVDGISAVIESLHNRAAGA